MSNEYNSPYVAMPLILEATLFYKALGYYKEKIDAHQS